MLWFAAACIVLAVLMWLGYFLRERYVDMPQWLRTLYLLAAVLPFYLLCRKALAVHRSKPDE